jgi:hypothetical protein
MAAPIPVPKTLDEHREYLYEIVRLKLHFMHGWLKTHPAETFADVLRNRVDIFRKTDVNQGALNPANFNWEDPAWQTLEQSAKAAYEACGDDADAYEREAFAVFQPTLDARCERDFHDRSTRNGYQCGCLRHNLEASVANGHRTLSFHIANFLSPESFFDYPGYVRDSFRRLLDIAENDFQADRIGTGTWLNSLPKWLEYFPQEWLDNLGAPNLDVKWHYGFWGQFLTARQTFNAKYGQILRTTGKMPFYPRSSSCSIQAMRAKIATL